FWGYEYLGICRPDISKTDNEQKWPISSRWNVPRKTNDIVRCRNLLNKLTADQMNWNPWDSYRQVLGSPMGITATRLLDARYIFSWNRV
ncbi:hypothetical protein MKW98_017280, partial [Papaver atlanticum]